MDLSFEINPEKKFRPLQYDDIPTHLKYKSKKTPNKNVHIGQRKLFFTELRFLLTYGHLSNTIIYAGAAGGHHIPFLSSFFPKHKFILWDPAPFAIVESEQITINRTYFTDEVAATITEKYGPEGTLFISDIRSGTDKMSFSEFEREVASNNIMQAEWVSIMKPAMSMLKFRVPYGLEISNNYEYLDGDIMFQPWAPQYSGETRLITKGGKTRIYQEYEAKMHYFNNIIRPHAEYDIVLPKVEHVKNNYDCSVEIYTWNKLFDAQKPWRENQRQEWIAKQMDTLSFILRRGIGYDAYSKNHSRD